jgi:uncharacterized protein
MKPLLLTCFLSISLAYIDAQENNSIVIGNIDSIHSNILKEERKIWVHVPVSARTGTDSKKNYPVVYLLDAEKNFTGVVGMIDLLSSVNGNAFWPEMIVVGIPNTDRTRDLTPTHVAEGLWIDSYTARVSGGGEAFISFIEKELLPHIDSNYHTTPYRMLIGHSYGGLTVMNTLVHHKDLFSSYIAIEPSMWWDKQRLLHESDQALKTISYKGNALFLAMAHTQSDGMDTTMVQSDTTDGTIHPRSILQLSKYIMGNRQNGLQASYKYYDDDSHASVPLIATYDALHFIFKDYQLTIQDSCIADPAFKLALFLQEHYEHMALKYGLISEDGRSLMPSRGQVDGLGYFVLKKKQFDKAEDMFKMNIRNYPASSEVYKSLGDFYAAKGDRVNAIKSYKKSLSLKETVDARKELEKLERK